MVVELPGLVSADIRVQLTMQLKNEAEKVKPEHTKQWGHKVLHSFSILYGSDTLNVIKDGAH